MKAILMSIKPRFVADILNGSKTIEVRKRFPLNYRGWVYIYVTKALPHLSKTYVSDYEVYDDTQWDKKWQDFNGEVVARFYCDNVEEITPFEEYESPFGMAYKLKENKIVCCQKAQLTYDEYNHYLKGKKGYAIHITKLEIFNKPKELSEFYPYFIDYKKASKYLKEMGVDVVPFKHGQVDINNLSDGISNILECEVEDSVGPLNSSYISREWLEKETKKYLEDFKLTKAPQSWQFIEVGD